MKKIIFNIIKIFVALAIVVPFSIITLILSLFARMKKIKSIRNARIVFGPHPIINNKYWSNALKAAGYKSQTYMFYYSERINKKDDFDEYTLDKLSFLPGFIRNIFLFWQSLFRFDVFVISYRGWLLSSSPFFFLEPFFFKLSGRKVVIIPYGSDAYVYQRIRSLSLAHGLMMSYPAAAKKQCEIKLRVDLWNKYADCVNPNYMGVDGIGRWDILRFSSLSIYTESWSLSQRKSKADGVNDIVQLVHSPNHAGVKGTEFIVDAVNQLKKEGLKVKLTLLQGVQNDEVKRFLKEDADILIEQVILTGHGISAVEGMASGLPVISNLEDENYMTIFRRWSFMRECPIVSATPENLVEELRKLVVNPELRKQLGGCGRNYVEKYHSYADAVHLFENILSYVYGEKESLIDLYHPLKSEYSKLKPMIDPPLINNKIQ